MIKHFIRYELPEDKNDLALAMNGGKYHSCLWEFKQLIKSKLKYGELTEEENRIWEWVQTEFINILDDNNCYLEEIE